MKERAIGTTFKVGKDELIVQEEKNARYLNEHCVECYFYDTCFEELQNKKKRDGVWRGLEQTEKM